MPALRFTRRTLGSALACAAACLLLPAAAGFAAGSKAPPGNSGVQEYVENVPDGRGGQVANKLYHGRNAALADPGDGLPERTQRALAGAGKDGAGAAALAEAGATDTKKDGSGEAGSSPFAAAVNRLGAASGPGGLGFFLPLLLVLLLGGALGYELKRRRAGS